MRDFEIVVAFPEPERGHSCPQQVPDWLQLTNRLQFPTNFAAADRNVRAPVQGSKCARPPEFRTFAIEFLPRTVSNDGMATPLGNLSFFRVATPDPHD